LLQVTFCGAARTVTGSMYYLEYIASDGGKFNFCLDAGMFQVGQKVNLFKVNSHLLFDPKKLDCIVLTHAHLDHCGRIPYLLKMGFGGKIYSSKATKQIAEVVMRDCARINTDEQTHRDYYFKEKGMGKDQFDEFDVEVDKLIAAKPEPEKENLGLYTEAEVDQVMPRFKTYGYHQKFHIHPELQVEFYDAGHILGSCCVVITEIKTGRKIVFSGDLGNKNKPIVEDPEVIEGLTKTTHIFIETTYGNKSHGEQKPKELLRKVTFETLSNKGKLIIPAFSVERAQEIIYFLVELMRENKIPQVSIYLDSPMASKVLEICLEHPQLYDQAMKDSISHGKNPLIYSRLKILESSQQSKSINSLDKPCIIIAGSGMLNGGRILKHLKFNLDKPQHTLLMVGYQAEGTLGKQILDGQKSVEIEGKLYEVKNRIELINQFSAHADQPILRQWVANQILSIHQEIKPTVFLMHGEKEASEGFGVELNNTFPDRLTTHWPFFGETVKLWS